MNTNLYNCLVAAYYVHSERHKIPSFPQPHYGRQSLYTTDVYQELSPSRLRYRISRLVPKGGFGSSFDLASAWGAGKGESESEVATDTNG